MAEFLKNNPITLRHCLLYEFVQKFLVEKGFEAFCMTVGNDVIKKQEFRFWFSQFEKGRFDTENGDEPISDMKDILRNDKYALRACVLYESLKFRQSEKRNELLQDPSLSMHDNFCKVIGEDVMEYREFDFWFYRFYNGEFDLNYERDENQKYHELTDMPLDIVGLVVEYLDIFDREALAKTTRSMRPLTTGQKLLFRLIQVTISRYNVLISLSFDDIDETRVIEYKKQGKDCVKLFNGRQKLIRGVSFWKQALLEFKNILENPKFHLNQLIIRFSKADSMSLSEIEEWKEAFIPNHQLNVKNLVFFSISSDQLLNILPHFKPKYFEVMSLVNSEIDEEEVERLMELEQLKHAKSFHISMCEFNGPLYLFSHFEHFSIWREELSLEDIREMKEILFKSPDFKKCSFGLDLPVDDYSAYEQEFGDAISENPNVYHYPIPNSNEYFEIKIGQRINVERMKK